MTPKPTDYELGLRPTYDPPPDTECLWHVLRTKSLRLHRLSDRVLGAIHIAVAMGYIEPSDCKLNESDLCAGCKVRVTRSSLHLGLPLLSPDGKAIISVETRPRGDVFECRGSGPRDLPVVAFYPSVLMEDYGYAVFESWLDSLFYRLKPDGTRDFCAFQDYPLDEVDAIPPGWPPAASRDCNYASEIAYKARGRKSWPSSALD